MDQNIKQRLVGIAVIFSLAVIFLPMILDGSGVDKQTLKVEIPPQPTISASVDLKEKIIELESKVDAIPDLEPRFVDEKTTGTENRISRNVEEEDRQINQLEAHTPLEPQKQKVADPEPAKVATPAKQASPPKQGGDSWVLQVGSFKDKQKALAERDRLRQSKIATVFIEQFNSGNQASFRVRLGPFPDKVQSQVARNKIKAKYDIDGLIMKYER